MQDPTSTEKLCFVVSPIAYEEQGWRHLDTHQLCSQINHLSLLSTITRTGYSSLLILVRYHQFRAGDFNNLFADSYQQVLIDPIDLLSLTVTNVYLSAWFYIVNNGMVLFGESEQYCCLLTMMLCLVKLST